MEIKQQKLKNRLKNAALLVLFLGMLVLTVLIWIADLGAGNIPEDSLLARAVDRLTYGVSGFEIRTGSDPAAEPTRIAVSGVDGLVGAQYHAASVSALYTVLRPSMAEGLKSCGNFQLSTEEDFSKALDEKVLYFGYEGSLPLALIAGWLGCDRSELVKTDLLLLTGNGEFFLHNEEGYRCAQTRVDSGAWDDRLEELPAGACSFAAQRTDHLLDDARPDTLLSENESTDAEYLSMRLPGYLDAQGGSDLSALLSAFQYDPNIRPYQENQEKTLVYVENYSTLRVSEDGTVNFQASAMEGGMEAYAASEIREGEQLCLQADFAYMLLKTVQSSMSDSSQSMLFDVTDGEDGIRILTFVQLVGGIPVQTEADAPFARFEFHGNQLMAAQLRLRAYETTGIRKPVLPAMQAAAVVPAKGLRTALVYVPDGETCTAIRCYQK